MIILIVGAGLSGCSTARLLKDRGHDVRIIEKQSYIGGLCITRIDQEGLKYEPFGARTFHTNNKKIWEFITKFGGFNDYVHRKGMIIEDKLFPFPITKSAINLFRERDKILCELKNRPNTIDKTNFETAAISIFGETLYKYFIKNYTEKMWGCDVRELSAEWIAKRLELREDNTDKLFKVKWQGLPIHGYTFLLENMIKDIPCSLNATFYNPEDYDVVVLSAPIDETLNYKYERLKYRSMRFEYRKNEYWENDSYGTINLPQDQRFIRKCNFKILHKQFSKNNLVQYQESIAVNNGQIPMYPINTKENDIPFDKYLKEICKTNICPIGRLGLFKYLDMDKAVAVAFDMVSVVENYLNFNPDERLRKIKEIISKY